MLLLLLDTKRMQLLLYTLPWLRALYTLKLLYTNIITKLYTISDVAEDVCKRRECGGVARSALAKKNARRSPIIAIGFSLSLHLLRKTNGALRFLAFIAVCSGCVTSFFFLLLNLFFFL